MKTRLRTGCHVVGRFEEAIEIVVPLPRNGRADTEGAVRAMLGT